MNIGYIKGLVYYAKNIRLKRELKKDNSMVRASGLFIINNDNEVLLAHPTNHSPNFWSIPKGGIEGDESGIEAAIRETEEEVNISFDRNLKFHEFKVQVYKHKKKSLQPFVIYERENPSVNFKSFELKCNSTFKDKNNNDVYEMDDFKWVPIRDAIGLVHETQKELLKILINNK